jgi:hypothetical protein
VRRLALSLYRVLIRPQDLSSQLAASRPFTPPIHTLVLPSKIPLDLRLHFRDLDEQFVVRGFGVLTFHEFIPRRATEWKAATGPHEFVGALRSAIRCGLSMCPFLSRSC